MAASGDWIVVDSDGQLGSCTSEQALIAIFGPPDGSGPGEERGLEESLDASIEDCGDAGGRQKRPTQRTLHDVIRGKPKAKAKANTRAHAPSHSQGSASSSSGSSFNFQRALAGLSPSNPTRHAEPVDNPDGPNQRVPGSAHFDLDHRRSV